MRCLGASGFVFRNEFGFMVSRLGSEGVEERKVRFEGRERLLAPKEDVCISGFGV